ncbi:hypothetical protein HID58_023833 [Brassica napus]|uniref:Uncharacterized protein n=1 Tax=Brassica napus TaxID=3708 RepID=A0ABQ8D5N8_BRANA|nr:hypothetical protein HID58_023833 [Brassica napus]
MYIPLWSYSETMRRPSQMMKLLLTSFFGVIVGFLMGITFPTLTLTKMVFNFSELLHIWVPTNPRGAERLPPDIDTPESDLYLRRLWGDPNDDLKTKQRYLVTFTVGYDQRENVDAALKKF